MNPALVPVLVLILALGFDAFCLVDLARANEVRYLPKLGWGLLICFLTPFGGIAYLNAGRVG
jgi:Ni/Fe-hydrogenase subunit HybB-like protein